MPRPHPPEFRQRAVELARLGDKPVAQPCGPGATTATGNWATAPPPTAHPVQVGTATNWARVSAGGDHTVAVKTDGTLWAWGDNNYGQLGDGTTTNQSTPGPGRHRPPVGQGVRRRQPYDGIAASLAARIRRSRLPGLPAR